VKEYSYRILKQAETDLDAHATYIAQDDLGAAIKLYDLAKQTYEMLSELPNIGIIHRTNKTELMGIRYMPIKQFSHYLVFYRSIDNRVDIIRVLHARTDRDNWL